MVVAVLQASGLLMSLLERCEFLGSTVGLIALVIVALSYYACG